MNKISNKIIFLALIPTIIVGLSVGVMIYFLTMSSGNSSIFAYEKTMRDDFDTTAKWETETVITMLHGVAKKYFDDEMSLDSAKLLGAELIRNLKYGKDGYFWVDELDGTNVVSSVKSLEGKNRIKLQDSDGKFIIKEFIRIAKKGGGFVNYRFPKTKGENPLPKRSYVKLFKTFNWAIGTGNYVDDIDIKVITQKNQQKAYLKKMLVIIILLLVTSSILIILAGKRIAKPIKILTQKSKLLAEGNLNVNIENNSKDEVGILANAIRIMTEKLNEIIEKISYEASRTSLASKEFKAASEKISDGANMLASTTEEVASSIEEMSANIHQNSENANRTVKISQNLVTNIKQGSKSVSQTSEALLNVTKEILIINEIAAKTNILALNASVEAASAGEYGRSFAIIAREIRELSDASSEAAQRISKVSTEGIAIANNSVELLKKLVPEIEKTLELISNINIASNEQESGATQINNEVMQLNRLSQQNAAIAQETEANSSELMRQAEQLIQAISFFRK